MVKSGEDSIGGVIYMFLTPCYFRSTRFLDEPGLRWARRRYSRIQQLTLSFYNRRCDTDIGNLPVNIPFPDTDTDYQ